MPRRTGNTETVIMRGPNGRPQAYTTDGDGAPATSTVVRDMIELFGIFVGVVLATVGAGGMFGGWAAAFTFGVVLAVICLVSAVSPRK